MPLRVCSFGCGAHSCYKNWSALKLKCGLTDHTSCRCTKLMLKTLALTHKTCSECTRLKCEPVVEGGLVYLIKHCAKPQMVYLAHTKNEKHSFTKAQPVYCSPSAWWDNQTVTHSLHCGALSNWFQKTWVRKYEKVIFVNRYLMRRSTHAPFSLLLSQFMHVKTEFVSSHQNW